MNTFSNLNQMFMLVIKDGFSMVKLISWLLDNVVNYS